MPMVDLPLAELRTLKGCNPKPTDFDSYWDIALAEMQGVDALVQLVPAEFQAPGVECFHLYFTSTKGARVYAKYLRPKGQAACPVVLQFHGYTGNSGDWFDKLAYVQAGFAVAALDCRGQAGKSQDIGSVTGNTYMGQIIRGLQESDPHKLLFRDIFLDTAKLARVVADFPEIDENRMAAMGSSQGGGLTLACAALAPQIKLALPCYPFLCDYKRVWEMDLCKDAYQELRNYFRMYDPRHEQEDAIFTKLGYIDVQHLAPRIKGQVYMGTGLMDTICPPSTQFAAYNNMGCKKDMAIYPDFGHEWLPDYLDKAYMLLLKVV